MNDANRGMEELFIGLRRLIFLAYLAHYVEQRLKCTLGKCNKALERIGW